VATGRGGPSAPPHFAFKIFWDNPAAQKVLMRPTAMVVTPHEQRLLEVETARVRHAWAKAQIESQGATPALLNYLKASLEELAALKVNDSEMEQTEKAKFQRFQTG
jgi:hypothetical protein